MLRYFYVKDGEKVGPFTYEELSQESINPDTLVWCDGMADWEPAANVNELKGLFSETAPAVPPVISDTSAAVKEPVIADQPVTDDTTAFQRPPKTWLTESILATIFCCLPLGIPGIVNATKVESLFAAGDIKGAQEASAKAARWTKYSVILGIVYIVIAVIYGISTGF